jgi:flagellin-like protein
MEVHKSFINLTKTSQSTNLCKGKEMTKTLKGLKTERGVSPVIATVILVAVAITVAVAVAYWMGGIAGGFTKFEQIEIQTGYSTKNASGWEITLELKNTGTAASSRRL